MLRSFCILPILVLLAAPAVEAQSFEAGLHLAASQWSEFDGTDLGIGGRLTWRPSSIIGVDADLSWYPSEFPSDGIAFSGSRFEGLFGVTAGPRFDRVRPFAKAAAGFLATSEAPRLFPCVTIFPPPLSCLMAGGHTLAAIDLGGGIEVSATRRTFLRVDATARMIQYPGPSFRSGREIQNEDFWGTAFRFTAGGGVRF